MNSEKSYYGFHAILICKKIVAIPFLFFAFSKTLQGQSPKDPNIGINVTSHAGEKKVTVNLANDKVIYNLLVIIADSTGKTVFLDNRYRFTGNYNNTIDLQNQKKGNYKLKIIRDEKRVDKNLKID